VTFRPEFTSDRAVPVLAEHLITTETLTVGVGEEVDVEDHEVEEEEAREVLHGHAGAHADHGEQLAQPHQGHHHERQQLVVEELKEEEQDADHDLQSECYELRCVSLFDVICKLIYKSDLSEAIQIRRDPRFR
jgi:hypothetical protein